MRWTRYEILLPQCYNDGRSVELTKFDETNVELLEKFSATTADTTVALGKWMYEGTVFEDQLQRTVVDVPGIEPAHEFFRQYKETLKARFVQIDIWISAHEIDIL